VAETLIDAADGASVLTDVLGTAGDLVSGAVGVAGDVVGSIVGGIVDGL
jgi:hypothetical protein